MDWLNLSDPTAVGWFFVPSALVLGALHGLEPGHSKTMMAAFIVAIRGTLLQATLLALAATISHTAIVWILALLALTYGGEWGEATTGPYFQIASGVIILGIAIWMLARIYLDQQAGKRAAAHSHGSHSHDETKRIDVGDGMLELSIFEEGVPPRFRIRLLDRAGREKPLPTDSKSTIKVKTTRPDGAVQSFGFVNRGAYLEAQDLLPEPHTFAASVVVSHGHDHVYSVQFAEHGHGQGGQHEHAHGGHSDAAHNHDHGPGAHSHDHAHPHEHNGAHGHSHDHASHGHNGHSHAHSHDHGPHDHEDGHSHEGLDVSSPGYQDAHERAHAREIQQRFANRNVTTGQVILFGMTGGLLPCSAAVTILVICLQLQKFWLGVALVLCFSIGLALTLLASGLIAAWSVRHVSKRWSGFDAFARRAPYVSGAVVALLGIYLTWQGLSDLSTHT